MGLSDLPRLPFFWPLIAAVALAAIHLIGVVTVEWVDGKFVKDKDKATAERVATISFWLLGLIRQDASAGSGDG
jgi:hypothetical protein